MPSNYKGKRWTVETESSFSFDFTSKCHPDLENIDWKSATGVQKSSGGSQGVYFVATPAGSLVVKGAMGVAPELFGQRMAESIGLNCPKCRVVTRETSEGQLIYNSLCTLDAKQPINRTVHSNLARRYIMVMEYLQSTPLGSFTSDKFDAVFGPSYSVSTKGEALLFQIGRVCGLDIFIHNTDRLPIVVENRGNLGNLMIVETGQLYII